MSTLIRTCCVGLALTVAAAAGVAEPRDHRGGRESETVRARDFAPRGAVTAGLPRGAYEIHHDGHRYWYHGGNWYAPYGFQWSIIAPPFGVFVPMLPGYYSTMWYGGVPYYYANDVYYVWRPERRAYEVVAPPAAADESTPAVPTDIYIYPRDGQTDAQQSEDRYQCHRWAANQTHFDPTLVGGGAGGNPQTGRQEYLRAMTACLEGRGYTVK